jgi:hypothetical protein
VPVSGLLQPPLSGLVQIRVCGLLMSGDKTPLSQHIRVIVNFNYMQIKQ